MRIRIGLAYNQKPPGSAGDDTYAEWDEPATIDAVVGALAGVGEVVRLEADASFPARLAAERPDFVFNIAEGLHGPNREAHVPAICEFLGVPYHASDPLTLCLALHKGRTKELLAARGVPTAPFHLVESVEEVPTMPVFGTSFVKPAFEGSGRGVTVQSLCADRDEVVAQVTHVLSTYHQPALVEEYLPGPEFTVAILGNGVEARCLPIVGLRFTELPAGAPPIYGYEAKWTWDRPEAPLDLFECPASISEGLADEVRSTALAAYRALGCRDWCRIDVRLDGRGRVNVIELNPLPGILPDPADNSCFPKAARVAGMTYDELLQTVADIAWRRISGRSLR